MIDLTDSSHRSSSDLDSGSGRPLVALKRDARAGFGRLTSIALITTFVAATAGWLWFLVEVAEWLIGV
jgi:hypothetical protein